MLFVWVQVLRSADLVLGLDMQEKSCGGWWVEGRKSSRQEELAARPRCRSDSAKGQGRKFWVGRVLGSRVIPWKVWPGPEGDFEPVFQWKNHTYHRYGSVLLAHLPSFVGYGKRTLSMTQCWVHGSSDCVLQSISFLPQKIWVAHFHRTTWIYFQSPHYMYLAGS